MVFDGYSVKPWTKDATHKRRKGATSTYSVKEHTMICKLKKDDLLSNEENKIRFINLLSQKLESRGCNAAHSAGDADTIMEQKAIQSAALLLVKTQICWYCYF